MDDPGLDDPGLCWPFWKFGMKRDDLYGKLHDQFNTFQSSIQDPEAFHHDVFEISKDASSTDEFYRLLTDRKEQRIRELNESLEAAALEIIANPSLIGTERWAHAAQLFRTRSLDSLVRYFASYLPINHRWRKTCDESSASETCSTVDSIANSHGSIFDGIDDGPIMTDEPLSLSTSLYYPLKSHLPPSPRSMTMCSDSSPASPIDECHHEYLDTLMPARTLSLSESDLGSCDLHIDAHCHEETSQLDAETPISEVSDVGSFEILDRLAAKAHLDGDYEEELPSQPCEDDFRHGTPADVLESDTPTPRPEQSAKGFFDTKPSPNYRRHRSASPARPHVHSYTHSHIHRFHHPHLHHDAIRAALQPRRRREGSPGQGRWRSPGDPTARISKPSPEPMRSRARASRRHDA